MHRKQINLGSYSIVGSKAEVPVLALDGSVLFPGHEMPISSLDGLRAKDRRLAEEGQLRVAVVYLKDGEGGPYEGMIGVEAIVTSILKMPNGETGCSLKGERRVFLSGVSRRKFGWTAELSYIEDRPQRKTPRFQALSRSIKIDALRLHKESGIFGSDVASSIRYSDDPHALCDALIPFLPLKLDEKWGLLASPSLLTRMKAVATGIHHELELVRLGKRIDKEVRGEIEESKRRHYIKEQIRILRSELGDLEEAEDSVETLTEEFEEIDLPAIVRDAVKDELDRLGMTSVGTPEYFVSYNYLTLMKELPWEDIEPEPLSLRKAAKILDRSHFGMEKIKERILENLAVYRHRKNQQGSILLLDGPPGVGKTSLAKSIADALNLPFAKVALGGVKDEAEVRGHRRTYVGSMPGKFITAIRQCGSKQCVILLDEIDKISNEGRSSVDAALLELLDPSQNHSFMDHFLSVGFDFSQVVFIATSNGCSSISAPLLDRMEIIELTGYSDFQKINIAKQHLIPSVRKEYGLSVQSLRMYESTIAALIQSYTRESGVRALGRVIESIARKRIRDMVERKGARGRSLVKPEDLQDLLGSPPYQLEASRFSGLPGVVSGLAYTDVGGELLCVEARVGASPTGNYQLKLTGSLGSVLKESAEIAITWIMANALQLELEPHCLIGKLVHIHLPDGGTPKDGPSAGLALVTAIVGALKDTPIPNSVAMTGEISLRGEVLPVGGIREKVLAAVRYRKARVLVPAANRADAKDLDSREYASAQIVYISSMVDALDQVGLLRLKNSASQLHSTNEVPVEGAGVEY